MDVPCFLSREERVETCKENIFSHYEDKQQEFLAFVLGEYVKEGVGELEESKLADLLVLKYGDVNDALSQLGSIPVVREAFVGF